MNGATLQAGRSERAHERVAAIETEKPRTPDYELTQRAAEGDMKAFEELYQRHNRRVYSLCLRMTGNVVEAEDLAQHVFLQVYKSAHRYEVSAKFSTWIFTIARNLCLNEIRRRTRHPADSLDATSTEDDQPLIQVEDRKNFSAPDAVLHRELESKIEEAIGALPEKQRIALLMCREDELSYEDMAKVLGCSLSATKSLIHRARETLKEVLKPYLRTGVWREAENS